jgi:DNA-binding response OmpR family regulator
MKEFKKIMIIDDDPDILDSVGLLLEFEGYRVEKSSSASSLFLTGTDLPDLVLLDIWLSGTDGRDICKNLKQKTSTRDIPVLLISASREIEKSAKDAGANDFLSKPFEVKDLLRKVEMHLH